MSLSGIDVNLVISKPNSKLHFQTKTVLKKFKKISGSLSSASGPKGLAEIKWKEHELQLYPHFTYDGFKSMYIRLRIKYYSVVIWTTNLYPAQQTGPTLPLTNSSLLLPHLSICDWNLSSISVHNFLKLSLFRAYITVHNFDVICLSETCFDLSILHDNVRVPGYNLCREDHPLNIKRRDVCIYYKISLPIKIKK